MLDELRNDIAALISVYEKTRKECDETEERLRQCEETNEEYRKQIIELERQIDNCEAQKTPSLPRREMRRQRKR